MAQSHRLISGRSRSNIQVNYKIYHSPSALFIIIYTYAFNFLFFFPNCQRTESAKTSVVSTTLDCIMVTLSHLCILDFNS